jgi:hypothetical protein
MDLDFKRKLVLFPENYNFAFFRLPRSSIPDYRRLLTGRIIVERIRKFVQRRPTLHKWTKGYEFTRHALPPTSLVPMMSPRGFRVGTTYSRRAIATPCE